MSDVLDALKVLKDNGLAGSAVEAVCNDLLDADEFEDSDDRKLVALCAHLDGETCIDECSYDSGCSFDVICQSYLVLDEDEKESRWDDCLESYLDDCGVEGADSPYFDRERWKRDARMDGAGHALSGYDGSEWEVAEYFIFRTN